MEKQDLPQETLDIVARNAKTIQHLEDPNNKKEKNALVKEAGKRIGKIRKRIAERKKDAARDEDKVETSRLDEFFQEVDQEIKAIKEYLNESPS